jgi:quercetin dioxygenase-like cupin family protein
MKIDKFTALLFTGIFAALTAGYFILHSPKSEPIGERYNNVLYKSDIDLSNGSEVLIREAYFPPGWKAPRHYHNGNLFIYVIEGAFEVDMEGSGLNLYKAGDALQMQPGFTMNARNPSATNSLKLSVFQLGQPDAPFVVPVKE